MHELCRRLDNLPLALELAAARTRVLSPRQLLERLSGRLDLLRAGRGADPRQETLRATIEWSHDLLDEEEQRLFARFAVFVGGCTLEDAEAVADADLDTLQSLVDKSLVRMREGNRFWMLETIREFALERFEASGEASELRRRHADHYLALVPRHGWAGAGAQSIASEGGESTEELERLERDLDNIRAAISWLQDDGDADRLLRLAHAFYWTFLYIRGRITEARPMLEAALSVAGGTDAGIRADVLTTVAILTGEAGEHEPARRLAAESLELAQSLGHSARIARALRTLARYQEEPAERRRLLLECETLAREAEDDWSLAWVDTLLGVDAVEAGDWAEGWLRLSRALESFNRLGSPHALETLGELGMVAAADGRYDEARALTRDAIRGALEQGLHNFVLPCLEAAAAIAIASGAPQAAGRLLGAAAAQREGQGEYFMYRIFVEKVESDCRDALGARFEEFVGSGRALSFEEAVELALATTERG
jgi:tetratricopeptide (TPR) repeat protein